MLINGQEHNDLCVGIDLGTTNSVLAFINQRPNGNIVSKTLELSRVVESFNTAGNHPSLATARKPTLPSCVYFQQERDYAPIVGDFAKNQYALRPHLVAKSTKSQMGEEKYVGLSEDLPETRPSGLAAHILKHMIEQAGKVLRSEIKDVVITVPANFDAAMCKATLEAAKLAGIKTVNDDGTERPVLLSEPNAVIYDLINQIHNGEVASSIIDLSEPKLVMVFDLGGGTLDITLHSIKWRDEAKTILKVDEIATNRYTLLGGDDFDRAIAEEMFKRYVEKNKKYGGTAWVAKMKQEKESIMPQLLTYAEDLKVQVSMQKSSDMNPDNLWEDDLEGFHVGGNLGNGYSYADYFTSEEVEAILERFMGKSFEYDDYKRIESFSSDVASGNIIFPILDVLAKASKKLQAMDVKVDEIVLNGGMSKFYMVIDRLKEFFGIEPIVALDPDQSVARGAAVYHYYLHQNEAALKEDMRLLGDDVAKEVAETTPALKARTASSVDSYARKDFVNYQTQSSRSLAPAKPIVPPNGIGIEFGSTILNDSLYLGLRNGAKPKELIPTGQELPYESEVFTGYKIEAKQDRILLPIQSKGTDGEIRTIEKGNIYLKKSYPTETYVAFNVKMSASKVLTMNAWVSEDEAGEKILEQATVSLSVGREEKGKTNSQRLAPPSGSTLNVPNELHNLHQLCLSVSSNKNKGKKVTEIHARIKAIVSNIVSCSNKAAFAPEIIYNLETARNEEFRERLFIIARKLVNTWAAEQKAKLAQICMNQIGGELYGFGCSGKTRNTNIHAIHALAMCGNEEQLKTVEAIENPKYNEAKVFAFSRSGVNVDWLRGYLKECVEKAFDYKPCPLGNIAYSIGNALAFDKDKNASYLYREEVVELLLSAVDKVYLYVNDMTSCYIALGRICDSRIANSTISSELIQKVMCSLNGAYIYSDEGRLATEKCRRVALKLINGEVLTADDEHYLLQVASQFEGE